MDENRFLESDFWAWYCEQSRNDMAHETELREAALALIVESVKSGTLTRRPISTHDYFSRTNRVCRKQHTLVGTYCREDAEH